MSLKQILINVIQNRNGDPVYLNEIEEICRDNITGKRYKLSNAERRLRMSEAPPEIERLYNEHQAIIGYYWQERNYEKPEPKEEMSHEYQDYLYEKSI